MTHQTKHKYFRRKVLRIYPKCVVCGTKENLDVHHKNDASHHPKQKYFVKNGVTLCGKHHVMFHTVFMYGFRSKCIKKDFDDFMEMISKLKIEWKEEIIRKVKEI